MAAPVPGVRAAVTSADLVRDLERCREFRDRVHDGGSYSLAADQVGELMDDLPATFDKLRSQVGAFADDLERDAG